MLPAGLARDGEKNASSVPRHIVRFPVIHERTDGPVEVVERGGSADASGVAPGGGFLPAGESAPYHTPNALRRGQGPFGHPEQVLTAVEAG